MNTRASFGQKCVVLVALACVAACADADPADEAPSRTEATPAAPLRPKTVRPGDVGALIGLPPEMLSRSMQGLSSTELPDGIRKVHLGGRFQHAGFAVIEADGTVHTSCASGTGNHAEHPSTPTEP